VVDYDSKAVMRLMIAGQSGHVTEAVENGDDFGRFQVPKTQLIVFETADHPLAVRRKRDAYDCVTVIMLIGECVWVEWQKENGGY
jgi:hypothetical protein